LPGIRLSDLSRNLHGVAGRDDINRLIAAGDIHVDFRAAALMEPEKVRLFPNREAALACQHMEGHLCCRPHPQFVTSVPSAYIDSSRTELPLQGFQALTKDGVRFPEIKISSALAAASEHDLKIANQRFEIVRRHLNCQAPVNETSISERTLRLWAASYRHAQAQYGSGYLGLIPKTRQRGNRGSKLPAESRALLNDYIEQGYETLKQKSKFSVWAALLHACQEKGIVPPSYATFCLAAKRRPQFESTLKRQGRRAAYTHEAFYWELELSTPRHGDRPFEICHIDHTELDVELVCSHTGRVLGRPWMTLMTDAFSRRCLAVCLGFDAPSYRSCMMILRDCVRRHGRLPQILVVDGGPEFQSTYFEALLARYECIKKTRPPAKARFGSCCERLFGTTNTRFIYNLQGNTQITRNIRLITKSIDPRELAAWTLAELHRRLSEFLFEVYDTIDHPTLGQSPREAFRTGFEASGFRAERMIPYDQEFLMATLPTTPKGTAKVMPGRGVMINHIYYWSSSFQVPGVENQQVPIRYDPFDAGTAYAFIEGRWVRCH
jgi:putative transposase